MILKLYLIGGGLLADKNSKSKNKGRRGEKELADKLTNNGITAERVPLSGLAGGDYNGDILIKITGDKGEVKRKKNK